MTNTEIIKDAHDAMRFLRTCGSDQGARQADAIQRLLSRMRKQDDALHRVHATLEEALQNIPPIEPRSDHDFVPHAKVAKLEK